MLTGVIAFLAFTFRLNGILILAAATAREFLVRSVDQGWRGTTLKTLLTPYVTFVLLFAVWSVVLPGGGEGHLLIVREISIKSIIINTLTYPVSLFYVFTGGYHSIVLAALLWPVVILGACRSFRRTAHISIYGLLTLALYFIWPAGGFRYMIPLTPFLVIFLMLGLDQLAHGRAAGKLDLLLSRGVQYGIPIALLIIALVIIGTGILHRENWNPYDQPSSQMFQWIRRNTSGDAVISFFKPRAMHLLGDRICLTATTADIRKASYLVYAKRLTPNEDQPSLEQYQHVAALISAFENRNFVVYRVGAKR